MRFLWPRSYFYSLIGVGSALLGWNLSQILLALGWPVAYFELLLFPIISLTLALSLTSSEIFLNNPTRPKLCARRLPPTLRRTSLMALKAGAIAGVLALIVFIPFFRLPAFLLRVVAWTIISGAIGHAEGTTWQAQSLEAGDPDRSQERLHNSRAAGIAAGIAAGVIFEIIRILFLDDLPPLFQTLEEPLGFALLGGILGYFLSLSGSPTYRNALRAGSGFEYYANSLDNSLGNSLDNGLAPQDAPVPNTSYPVLHSHALSASTTLVPKSPLHRVLPFLAPPSSGSLKFVSRPSDTVGNGKMGNGKISRDGEVDRIEEGLSIQLPTQGRILIGDPQSPRAKTHIILPGFDPYVAHLEVTPDSVTLTPNSRAYHNISHNNIPLKSYQSVPLKHNDILTFRHPNPTQTHGPKFYRFVYYNRFLDPEA